jgi:3-oxoacyl-[acyl-carrier-protein] synthase III
MDGRELKSKAAISGLGISEMGRVYGHDASHFAAEAIQRALDDAGLRKDQIDGLLVIGVSPSAWASRPPELHRSHEFRLLSA